MHGIRPFSTFVQDIAPSFCNYLECGWVLVTQGSSRAGGVLKSKEKSPDPQCPVSAVKKNEV